jgi:hypothetical protein
LGWRSAMGDDVRGGRSRREFPSPFPPPIHQAARPPGPGSCAVGGCVCVMRPRVMRVSGERESARERKRQDVPSPHRSPDSVKNRRGQALGKTELGGRLLADTREPPWSLLPVTAQAGRALTGSSVPFFPIAQAEGWCDGLGKGKYLVPPDKRRDKQPPSPRSTRKKERGAGAAGRGGIQSGDLEFM